MPDTDKIVIKRLPLGQAVRLQRLFEDAVRTSFTYFDDEVQQKTIRDHSTLHLLLAAMHPRRIVLTAWRGPELVGYAIGSVPSSGDGQLYWLYVAPGERGSNTGLGLLSRMLRRQRALGAHSVNLASHDHRRYYERQGFRYLETRPIDGVNMDIMRYTLS